MGDCECETDYRRWEPVFQPPAGECGPRIVERDGRLYRTGGLFGCDTFVGYVPQTPSQ
jgi:hypothetical protein